MGRGNRWGLLPACATLLLCAGPPSQAADETLLRAQALLEANNARAAYELLSPLQSERAGAP
jgi:hypothetical protein